MIQMDLFTEQKETQQKRTDLVNSDLEVTRGGGSGRRMWEGIVREFGMDMDTLLCLKWITSKDLLHSTGNSAQCDVAVWGGGGVWGRMDTCVYIAESLHCSPEITQHCQLDMLRYKIKRFLK